MFILAATGALLAFQAEGQAQTSKDIRRLRNLTFNVTAIPLLTFVNEMRMTHLTETGKVSSPSKAIWPIASVA